jgi:NADP-dependent aldehyde dehydrogenase
MPAHPLLLDGRWCSLPARRTFHAFDPQTGAQLADEYPVSTLADLEGALAAGARAATAARDLPGEAIARFFERYGRLIEQQGDAIAAAAHAETALPLRPRLRETELARTVAQLEQAALAVREGTWSLPTIDTVNDLRSMYEPLGGVVLVFGPGNFPLAYNSIAGGDFAAALAAGNAVLAKAHPGHPTTSRLLAEAASEAAEATGLPPGLVQLFYDIEPDDGLALLARDEVVALGFTGSRAAGLRLKAAAERAHKLAYLEMSSINPVFILPGALAERGSAIAAELAQSCLLASGQLCTNPGFIVVPADEHAERLFGAVRAAFAAAPAGVMLSKSGVANLAKAVAELRRAGAEVVLGGEAAPGPGFRFANTLLRVTGDRFLSAAEALQTEAFGTASLFVFAAVESLPEVATALHGNLTASVYTSTTGADEDLYRRVAPILRGKAGRLLNDRMPTGVTPSPAMVHGGPFPATGHPGFTAVGMPASIRRFAALHCYDRVRPERLPPLLGEENPTGAWRYVDGEWQR